MVHLPGIVDEDVNPWEKLTLLGKAFNTFETCEIQLPEIDLDSSWSSLQNFLESFDRRRRIPNSKNESLGGKCSNVVCYLQADSYRISIES